MDEFEDIKYKVNLKDIKSSFIINIIFSFLCEKQLLNMIIYNKELQKMLQRDIENYKKISYKYKIGERNGKGQEYIKNTNKLIFEGEYLNGKRNGKGKEYDHNGRLEYEGEYLNGKRNGKGKEYYDDGKLKFEGEYLNGIGKGKEYDHNGRLEYEGEYLNGNRNGKGKEYYYNGRFKYEGEYLNGKRNGRGKEYYFNCLGGNLIKISNREGLSWEFAVGS